MSIARKTSTVELTKKEFESLISTIYQPLYRYIYCIMRNRDSADDVLQNTFLVAYVNLQSLRSNSAFKSWIFTIAKREALSYIKKHNREITYDDVSDFNFDDNQLEFEQMVTTKETKAIVTYAINELNDDYRDVIILRYFVDLSIEGISTTLRINVNTVKTRLKRAKSMLAEIINKKYKVDEDGR